MKQTNPYYLNPQAIANSFNRAAATYDNAAELPREIAKRMNERLNIMKIDPQVVIDAGTGTGITTELLACRYPNSSILATDIAFNMLNVAKQKVTNHRKQHFVTANSSKLPLADNSVDMIVSNLMLHWCSDLPVVIREWSRILRPEGLLMFSTYGPNTLTELRRSWAAVDSYTHVNGFVEMHDLGDMLMQTGFVDPVTDIDRFTLTYPNVQSLMKEFKAMGIHNINQGRNHHLTGKNKFKKMITNYELLRTENNKIPASFEVIYGHAWKSPLLAKNLKSHEGEVSIPLSSIERRNITD